ncbi:MAG: hypothetical protein M3468_16945 [Acidobacteriota bacterium]|nr:hypothetical protein [Acidobacteriota bacterium]
MPVAQPFRAASPFRKKWAAYLHPQHPVDAYRIAGNTITLQTADPVLRQLFRDQWGQFRIAAPKVSEIHAAIRVTDPEPTAPITLKSWHGFVSDRFVFLSDRKRYLLTGYLREHPWQIDCVTLARWDPRFVYYHLIEPLLLDLLKRLGVLVWHGAAVAKNGRAVLLSGVSGSGKSTTTLNLLRLGYRFIADDVVLLRAGKAGIEVTGWERAVFLTDRSLDLLPEWRRLRSGRRHKRGRQWKHRIDLSGFAAPAGAVATVKSLVFPHVAGGTHTILERLTPTSALLQCLQQPPKEFPATILPAAVDRQLDLYTRLVRTAAAYRVHLGADQERIRAVLERLR